MTHTSYHLQGIIQNAEFSDGFPSLSDVYLPSLHVISVLETHFFLVLNNSPLHGQTTVYSLTEGYPGFFQALAMMIQLL